MIWKAQYQGYVNRYTQSHRTRMTFGDALGLSKSVVFALLLKFVQRSASVTIQANVESSVELKIGHTHLLAELIQKGVDSSSVDRQSRSCQHCFRHRLSQYIWEVPLIGPTACNMCNDYRLKFELCRHAATLEHICHKALKQYPVKICEKDGPIQVMLDCCCTQLHCDSIGGCAHSIRSALGYYEVVHAWGMSEVERNDPNGEYLKRQILLRDLYRRHDKCAKVMGEDIPGTTIPITGLKFQPTDVDNDIYKSGSGSSTPRESRDQPIQSTELNTDVARWDSTSRRRSD